MPWVCIDSEPVEVAEDRYFELRDYGYDGHIAKGAGDSCFVSTVCLPDPVNDLLFETMIFGGPHDHFQRRYATYELAMAGHNECVRMVGGVQEPATERHYSIRSPRRILLRKSR
jgi:hypothetical protein